MPAYLPLIALRELFPDDRIPNKALAKLDRELQDALGEAYAEEEFIRFVVKRQRRGRIEVGLVFEGLRDDFIAKVGERRARAAATAQPKGKGAAS